MDLVSTMCQTRTFKRPPIRNLLDIMRVVLELYTCLQLHLQEEVVDLQVQVALAAWTAWQWLRCLFALRGFRAVGPKVLPVVFAVQAQEMFGFLVVMLFTLAAATNGYMLFALRQEPSKLYASVLVIYRLAVLGDVDLFEFEGLDTKLVQDEDAAIYEPEDPPPSDHYEVVHA
eukprot:600356-Amphidinium_carterae.1